MSKQVPHYPVQLKIANGQTSVSKLFTMPYGFVTGVAIYTNGVEKDTKEVLSLALKEDNIEIVPMVNIQHYQQTSGEYTKSFKPLNFDSMGKQYTLVLSSTAEAVDGNNPQVEVVFLFDTKNERVL